MNELRTYCPWDQKQTLESLRQLTIEEVYELADAIDEKDFESLKEELGDILLHLVFYTKIAQEQKQFGFGEVIQYVCDKLIHRHPHIYSQVEVEDEEQVKKNWEQLKLKEGKKSLLAGVPNALPAMVKAMRVQEKAKQVGFEWNHVHEVREKLDEELQELQIEIDKNDQDKIEDEFGDVLFSIVNYARFLGIDPEKALARTNQKFISRFQKMEEQVWEQHQNLNDLTLEEMDAIWNRIKKAQPK
jgi:XTP/dITP diphosphohydrolase